MTKVFKTEVNKVYVRIGAAILVATGIGGFVSLLGQDRVVTAILCLLVMVASGWLCLVRLGGTHVTADVNGIRIRNPIRTRSLAWAEIESFRHRPHGPSVVHLTSGRMIAMWAIDGQNWERLAGRKDTAESRMVAELTDLLEQARSGGRERGPAELQP